MTRAKYITLLERDGTVRYVTGKKKNIARNTKIIAAPVLDESTKYYDKSYDCMGDWHGTQEFKEWVRDEAEEWAEEINAELCTERRQYGSPIPEV